VQAEKNAIRGIAKSGSVSNRRKIRHPALFNHHSRESQGLRTAAMIADISSENILGRQALDTCILSPARNVQTLLSATLDNPMFNISIGIFYVSSHLGVRVHSRDARYSGLHGLGELHVVCRVPMVCE
jgi:hypothetical protein